MFSLSISLSCFTSWNQPLLLSRSTLLFIHATAAAESVGGEASYGRRAVPFALLPERGGGEQ